MKPAPFPSPQLQGRNAPPPDITSEMDQKVEACIKQVLDNGKRPKTVKQYSGAVGHWIDVCYAKGWDPLVDEESAKERSDKLLWYFAYERAVHN